MTPDFELLKENSVKEFLAFARTPRPSFHLDSAREYIRNFAQAHGWRWQRDAYGNCWFDVDASAGYESYPPFILQAHMDMVCDAAPGESLDFQHDVGTPRREGDLLRGERMNLGADNGIGLGIIFALVSSDTGHGPLRCLFTADEETGMQGAASLDASTLNARYLISLDGEQKGNVYRGCAGAITFSYEALCAPFSVHTGLRKITLTVGGLKGGHSGREIHSHRLSGCVVVIRVLSRLVEKFGALAVEMDAGLLHNAIATGGRLSVAVNASEAQAALKEVEAMMDAFAKEYPEEAVEKSLEACELSAEDFVCSEEDTMKMVKVLGELHYGVVEMDGDHVTKSSNISPVSLAGGKFEACSMMRSDFNEWLDERLEHYRQFGAASGVEFRFISGNPAWYSEEIYPMVAMLKGYYQRVLGHEIGDYRTPGGVEPSYFCKLRPDLQVTCFGPQIENAHTYKETLHLEDVKAVLMTTVHTLQHINELG